MNKIDKLIQKCFELAQAGHDRETFFKLSREYWVFLISDEVNSLKDRVTYLEKKVERLVDLKIEQIEKIVPDEKKN